MSNTDNIITEMPKAELGIHLEGAFRKETLLMIAEQNDAASKVKRFKDWVDLLHKPDFARLDEMHKTYADWFVFPDDITRIVYDLGVSLARQNVRYAEVHVNPVLHMLAGMQFEAFLESLNDGRDRAMRGWDIKLNWILVVPRDEPRRADEISRWSTNASAKKANVVGFGLVGPEDAQPIGQFERSFATADKKDTPTVAQTGHVLGVDGIQETLEFLQPHRLIDAWRLVEDDQMIGKIAAQQIPIVTSIASATQLGWIENISNHPVRRLYDENVKVIMSCPLPTYYARTITDEYLALAHDLDFETEEIVDIALNAVRYSFLPDDEKSEVQAEFEAEYERLMSEDEDLVSEPDEG